jgi:hypothetical protein
MGTVVEPVADIRSDVSSWSDPYSVHVNGHMPARSTNSGTSTAGSGGATAAGKQEFAPPARVNGVKAEKADKIETVQKREGDKVKSTANGELSVHADNSCTVPCQSNGCQRSNGSCTCEDGDDADEFNSAGAGSAGASVDGGTANQSVVSYASAASLAVPEERPLVDKVYDFLAVDMNYVLLGDMRPQAGHPSFAHEKPKPTAKTTKFSPEERLVCSNLLRHLDLRELAQNPKVESRLARTMHLLQACGYPWEDIVTVFAFAAIYFPSIRQTVCRHTHGWDADEVINVLIILIYLSHTFCFDETCPIGHWHRWIFRNYCSLDTLNLVVVRVLQLRGYNLTVSRKEWRGVCFVLQKGIPKAAQPHMVDVNECPDAVDG